MKTRISFLLCLALSLGAQAQSYWQQEVSFNIEVRLDDKENRLDGFARIGYRNHSPDTLQFIWFHLWPNAYKNDRTAFSDQILENGSTRFYFSGKEEKGFIHRLDFRVAGKAVQVQDHPEHIDIVKLLLPSPLLPGGEVEITTPFRVKLPFNVSRGGYDGHSYQVTQWYPKPAVYDREGWHPMPYLDQGEFYSEFGSFDVRITVPENYVVAATGELRSPEEEEWLRTRTPPAAETTPESASNVKTMRFTQDRVHDFAWFADKRFVVDRDTVLLPSGRIVTVRTYYTPAERNYWKHSLSFAKDALRFYSAEVGEYPYNVLSVVQGPRSFGGGMEYPTITVISPVHSERDLDMVIAHEIGHNWFYGILASDERKYAWMDEGLNSFYDAKYQRLRYGPPPQLERILFDTKATARTDQPINLRSEEFSADNYYLSAYYKAAEWFRYIESLLGEETFKKGIQTYFSDWQFRHPRPADLRKALEEVSGRDLSEAFALLDRRGLLPNQSRSGMRFATVLQPKGIREYLLRPTRDLILLGPAAGVNVYDDIMIGAFLTNVKLPPSKFQFFAAPMYATGSKRFTGLGYADLSIFPEGRLRKIKFSLLGSRFSHDEYEDEQGGKTIAAVTRVVPSVKLIFRNTRPRSAFERFVQVRSFFMNEQEIRFFADTLIAPGTPPDTSVAFRPRLISDDRTVTQLRVLIANHRALYPYSGEWKFEHGKHFVRAAFTGKYFFNYSASEGLEVRFFAGKFFYLGERTLNKRFATDRYHLNLTGPDGYEDYTYSDYFPGRNEFEGFASRQIMLRDGAFKVRTDLLASKIGKTDDWLVALNFSGSLPDAINPLRMLPVKLPIRLFLDIGTYAEAWEKDATGDRFLYDAGLHIALFAETVHLYIPLLYSAVYKEYFQSTFSKKERFWQKLSFAIDISNFSMKKMDRRLEL
ncbi:MAG TPA: M1 family metallopeptidase [Chitinophagaceae bacterium]|nr:M1 family metallopeptidase [Chitinophagaceae bacterium]